MRLRAFGPPTREETTLFAFVAILGAALLVAAFWLASDQIVERVAAVWKAVQP